MSIQVSDEYFRQKKALLQQCLHFSEDLISSIEAWEAVPSIVSKKEAAILQLSELEEATAEEAKASLTLEMKQELDQLIKLIMDLDQDATRMIRMEQEKITSSLKSNTQEQKLTQYAQMPEPGRKLDYKK